MNDPIARWTLGPVSYSGMEILRHSIDVFSQNYPEFRMFLCYNNLDFSSIQKWGFDKISRLNLIKQEDFKGAFDMTSKNESYNGTEATGSGWKFCPVRLDPNSFEMFLDNDLVIRERIPSIDKWLSVGGGIVSSGVGRKRMFGKFDPLVPKDLHLCAGFFGVPPGFDLESEIKFHYDLVIMKGKVYGFDEQGLTCSVISNMKEYIVVPQSEMFICEDHIGFLSEETPPAVHFVNANSKDWHSGWKEYKRRFKIS